MQPSQELRDAVMRAVQDLVAKNASAFLGLYSREPGVIVIGTAPTEWLEGFAAFEPMLRATVEGGSGMMPQDIQIQAWQEGSVGWAATQWTGRLPNGGMIKFRNTGVFHLESGAWRCVHQHSSVGVPDNQVMSIAQPGQ